MFFQDTTKLAANHIVVSIDPKQADIENGLQPVGRGVIERKHACCGFSFEDFPRQIWAGQHTHWVTWTVLVNHLGHPLLRRGFESLGHTDDGSAARNQRCHLLKHTSKVVRGNGHENSVGVGHGLFETRGCG